ncbi:MAG TPA: alpha-L-fucosidase, partial [Armatimonadota bacterium]
MSATEHPFPAGTAQAHRTDWFHQAQWGVFTHYLTTPDLPVDDWNRLIDDFDVPALAAQLASVGARYYCLTIGQNSGHFCAPNATYDRYVGITPSKCSRRDLVADIYRALEPYGIKMLVYLPSGAPDQDPTAIAGLDWQRGPFRNREFQQKWEAVIREWSERWGDNVHGWWYDGCYYADAMYRQPDAPNFASFAAATRAGNPQSLVAFNPGVQAPAFFTEAEDYTAGEVNEAAAVECNGRWVEGGIQWHMLSFLGPTWGAYPPRFSAAQVLEITRNIIARDGVVTWDVPIQKSGLIPPEFLAQLAAIKEGLANTSDTLLAQRVTVVAAPVISAGGQAQPGQLRLTAKNLGSREYRGTLTPWAEPASAVQFHGDTRFPITLAPGQETSVMVALTTSAAQGDDVCVGAEGSANAIALPIRREISLPRLPALPLAEVAGTLAHLPARPITFKGETVATLRVAVAGDTLALSAEVTDHCVARGVHPWEASCVEVFGTGPDEVTIPRDIGQVFLLPATANDAAGALTQYQGELEKSAGTQLPEARIQVQSSAHEAGYRLQALIPLDLLHIPAGGPFRLEVSLTTARAADGQRIRPTLFGSSGPNGSNQAYGRMVP